jgi:hypothetical protein
MRVELGKAYLAVRCRQCERGLAFQEAPPTPEEGVQLPNSIQLTCHACGFESEYDPREVQRLQGRYMQ